MAKSSGIETKTWLSDSDPVADSQYCERLKTLSEGSVRASFNPYLDIDWESPELAVIDNDPRWILPETDPIFHTDWYQSLSYERKIEVGMWRQANVAKVGLQFENLLMRGMVVYCSRIENGSPEFRYCMHELLEECNHNLMFQETVNRIGAPVSGVNKTFLAALGFFSEILAMYFPSAYFAAVLAGEEPIDFVQKAYLREGKEMHPILTHIMGIHVAEEARHISFAHEFLKLRAPRSSRFNRFVLSITYPILMRVVEELIVVPPANFWNEFNIPKEVKKGIFWKSPESRDFRRRLLADSRHLAHEMGIMNPVSKLLWKLLGIDGRPSRFRSEPQRRHFIPNRHKPADKQELSQTAS